MLGPVRVRPKTDDLGGGAARVCPHRKPREQRVGISPAAEQIATPLHRDQIADRDPIGQQTGRLSPEDFTERPCRALWIERREPQGEEEPPQRGPVEAMRQVPVLRWKALRGRL